ncbi:MAG: TolC family protein [Rickettsiales bacterium]|nr:TolC family protein [Rickettsiales bacterium]
MNKLKFFLILSLLILSNCSDYKQLKTNKEPDLIIETPIPQEWQSSSQINQNVKIAENGWISEFDDPIIKYIAETVIANNQDLKVAANNLKAAEAAAEKAGADLNPSANLNIGNQQQGSFDNSNSNSTNAVAVDVAWEIDIWGKLSAASAQAESDYQASKAEFNYAQESLIAQAIKAYLLAIEAQQQKDISLATQKSYEKELKISKGFFEAGAKTSQDVAISEANLALAADNLIRIENGYFESIRSLELLLGEYPAGKFKIPSRLPKTPENIATGIPSNILENRPDLMAAEAKVASAFNATTIAKAAKLPTIALTSNLGGTSDDLNNLADPRNLFWNFAGNIITPLFDSGKLQNNVEIADSQQKAAIAEYQSAALNAFNDVETALNNEKTIRQSINLLKTNYEQSKIAYNIENSKFIQGSGSIFNVNQLNRAMILAESELVKAKRELLTQRINLYLALGIPAFKGE